MTNEYVQRLAEWLELTFARLSIEFSKGGDSQTLAQDALSASGALSRIEELEKVLRYVLRTSQGVDFGHQVVVRSDGKEQTLAGWIAEVLDGAALSQAQQSDE